MNLGILGFPANGSNTADTQVPRLQTYTTAGTTSWTVPDGVRRIAVEVWGGGSGGYNDGGGNTGYGAGGGYTFNLVSVQPGETLTVIVGAGGANQGAVARNVGGTSSVASAIPSFTTLQATGGTAANFGGAGSGGALNLQGGSGWSNAYAWADPVWTHGFAPRTSAVTNIGFTTPTDPGCGGTTAAVGSGNAGAVFIYY